MLSLCQVYTMGHLKYYSAVTLWDGSRCLQMVIINILVGGHFEGFIVLNIYQLIIILYQIYFNLFRKINILESRVRWGEKVSIGYALIKHDFQCMQNIHILAKLYLCSKVSATPELLGQILVLFSFMCCLLGVKMVV